MAALPEPVNSDSNVNTAPGSSVNAMATAPVEETQVEMDLDTPAPDILGLGMTKDGQPVALTAPPSAYIVMNFIATPTKEVLADVKAAGFERDRANGEYFAEINKERQDLAEALESEEVDGKKMVEVRYIE